MKPDINEVEGLCFVKELLADIYLLYFRKRISINTDLYNPISMQVDHSQTQNC